MSSRYIAHGECEDGRSIEAIQPRVALYVGIAETGEEDGVVVLSAMFSRTAGTRCERAVETPMSLLLLLPGLGTPYMLHGSSPQKCIAQYSINMS